MSLSSVPSGQPEDAPPPAGLPHRQILRLAHVTRRLLPQRIQSIVLLLLVVVLVPTVAWESYDHYSRYSEQEAVEFSDDTLLAREISFIFEAYVRATLRESWPSARLSSPGRIYSPSALTSTS